MHRALHKRYGSETLRYGTHVSGYRTTFLNHARQTAFYLGTAEIWCAGVVHSVRVQRWRPQRVRYLLGEASLRWICFLANRAVHGEPQDAR